MKDSITLTLYSKLKGRYAAMAGGLKSEDKINKMMEQVVLNCLIWPDDKLGRWVGYVQCLLIEVEKVTTTDKERDFTRPLFHKLYEVSNIPIPTTVKI